MLVWRSALHSLACNKQRLFSCSKIVKMSSAIGVNLRVTGHCHQGGRKYMEDVFSVVYEQTEDEAGLAFAYFGIFDGHGGAEAALFAKVISD